MSDQTLLASAYTASLGGVSGGDTQGTERGVTATDQRCLINVPSRSSAYAWRSSVEVFMTIGPCQATGSSSGRPDTSRKRIPASPAWTVISSPESNKTRERLPASSRLVVPAGSPTHSVSTPRGAEASRNDPLPSKM